MAILKILTYPHNFLRKITRPLDNIDGDVQKIIENMTLTMYEAPGVGLAASQVGIDKQLLVYDSTPGEETSTPRVLINPRIVDSEGEILSENEGCLSVPEYRSNVKRSSLILVEGLDRDGNPLRFEAEGFLAIILQHEIDHLNGKLFIDHLSSLKRQLYKKKIKKMLKNQ